MGTWYEMVVVDGRPAFATHPRWGLALALITETFPGRPNARPLLAGLAAIHPRDISDHTPANIHRRLLPALVEFDAVVMRRWVCGLDDEQ